jgi:hypothetical protein
MAVPSVLPILVAGRTSAATAPARSRPITYSNLPGWVNKWLNEAEELQAQGLYGESIEAKMGLVLDGLYNGGNPKTPDLVLLERLTADLHLGLTPDKARMARLYLPLPEEYLEMAVAFMPAELKAMDAQTRARFILMLMAMLHQESRFNPKKDSCDSAVGLGQITLDTAETIMGRGVGYWELRNPAINIAIAERCLYKLFCLTSGRYDFNYKTIALAGYNGGSDFALSLLKNAGSRSGLLRKLETIGETSLFVKQVMAKYELYKTLYEPQLVKQLEEWSASGYPDPHQILREQGIYLAPEDIL